MLRQSYSRVCENIADLRSITDVEELALAASDVLCFEHHHLAWVDFSIPKTGSEFTTQSHIVSSTLSQAERETLVESQIVGLRNGQLRGDTSTLPLFWSSRLGKWEKFLISKQPNFIEQNSVGEDHALALVHQLNTQICAVLVVTKPDIKSDIVVAAFHSLGLNLFQKISELRPKASTPILSKNERNCLVWSACGKTSSEIAIILSLSEHTVNHYFTIAAAKLGADNRTHATAKAIQLGLIGFEEIT